jgi:hypothetical protein
MPNSIGITARVAGTRIEKRLLHLRTRIFPRAVQYVRMSTEQTAGAA